MHLLVQSKLRLVSHEHLPRNFYSQIPEDTAVYAVKSHRAGVRLEGVPFDIVSYMYMAMPISGNDAINFELMAFSKIHGFKTL